MLKSYKDFAELLLTLRRIYAKKKLTLILGVIFWFFVFVWPISLVYAQSTPITISGEMNLVIFDGKWTFPKEWKASSYVNVSTNTTTYVLRSAHQDEFIYLMLDAIQESTIDNGKDRVVFCFDAKNDQSVIPDANDYCFMVKLGSDKPETLQGSEESGEFKAVENHVDLIGVGGTSDENDRYSKVPHPTYEFRIPIELLGRNHMYGFYVAVYDHTTSQKTTWPSEIDSENSEIPSPAKWGIIYSPDKSLPEYDVPMLVLVIGIFLIILLSIKSRRYNLLKIPS